MRYLRLSAAGLLVLVVALASARAARPGTTAPCVLTGSSVPGIGYHFLSAQVSSRFDYVVPFGIDSVSGGATVTGSPEWGVWIENLTGSTVTDPTITFSSGLDPSLFTVYGKNGASTPPFACTLPSLDDGRQIAFGLGAPEATDSFSLGYDSSVSSAQVPPGGGQVTVALSVRFTNPALGPDIFLYLDSGGNTIVSMSAPTNLGPGESASAGGGQWTLSNGQLDKTYVFTAVVDVSNPTTGPITFVPGAQFYGGGDTGACAVCNVLGPSATVALPSLEGSVTLSVDQSGYPWTVDRWNTYVATYQGGELPTAKDQCMQGGWQGFGVFANQGDCVSYVASGGKNPPAG